MISTIGKYTQSIAMIIIFTTVISLLMPSGDFQKYIKMVLGLIVMLTILAPINTLIFRNKPTYADFLGKYETNIENATIQSQSGQYLEAQKDIILESYKEKLTPQMIGMIERANEVQVLELDMDFNEDTNATEFGSIISINMIIEPAEKKSRDETIKIPKIKVGSKETQSYSDDQGGQIEESIKTCLIDFYNLSDVNINIIVQKNS